MRTLLVASLFALACLSACSSDGGSSGTPARTGGGGGANATSVVLVVSPRLLDFGEVELGGTRTLSFSVENTGSQTAEPITILVVGSSFTLDDAGSCRSLTPSSRCSVTVRFTPTAGGASSGVADVNYGTGNGSTPVSLSGRGVQPAVVAPSFCSGVHDGGVIPSTCSGTSSRFSLSEPGDGGAGDGRVYDMRVGALPDGGLPDGGSYNGGSWVRWPMAASAQAAAVTACGTRALPSKDEALSVAAGWYNDCLWPTCWTTWTTTPGATAGSFWVVGSDGRSWEAPGTDLYPALCVSKH